MLLPPGVLRERTQTVGRLEQPCKDSGCGGWHYDVDNWLRNTPRVGHFCLVYLPLVDGLCDGCCWQKTSTPMPTAVPTPLPGTVISSSPTVTNDTETLVLTQVRERISMCPPDSGSNAFFISADETAVRFRLACGGGWGHVADVTIWRYDNSPAVQAALPTFAGPACSRLSWLSGHCVEVLARSYVNCEPSSGVAQGMLHRNHCWQADRWLICAHAFDDTDYETAVDPLKISEAVYQASLEHGLLPKKH